MKRGRFKTRVRVEKKIARNDLAGTPDEWQLLGETLADIRPLRGIEYQQAQQTQSHVTHKAWTRPFTGANSSLRLVSGSRVFHVEAVFDLDERHHFMQWMLTEKS